MKLFFTTLPAPSRDWLDLSLFGLPSTGQMIFWGAQTLVLAVMVNWALHYRRPSVLAATLTLGCAILAFMLGLPAGVVGVLVAVAWALAAYAVVCTDTCRDPDEEL